jgi:hypothetical protein
MTLGERAAHFFAASAPEGRAGFHRRAKRSSKRTKRFIATFWRRWNWSRCNLSC